MAVTRYMIEESMQILHLKAPKKCRISDKNIQLELDRKMCSDIFKSGKWKKAISMLCASSNIT